MLGHTFSAGAADSCKAGTAVTLASTSPGQQGALASASEAFNLAIRQDGVVTITQRATGAVTTIASPGANCHGPFQVGDGLRWALRLLLGPLAAGCQQLARSLKAAATPPSCSCACCPTACWC
jgi:hypothetical protein